ncbi:hypothetical protein Plim_2204 [Planctopirus limnophila DSM 3776]|uniref:DUF4340 domain-containing protein n=1 Tax=Planctopirus limnophila (strain ATCC 43296 / DSM 3776 / IFAM 1008 / Mu 290) TaxID=521674 RepID=D5SMX5_PLAL2|nr:DUF4340 domain-containing protein [Planctopirus limnophila]ADG68030.1 hypothetical protein Plim_2204 [Planctopirus limnophila DSM 3776]
MRETQRTLIFAGVALVALVAALFAGPSTPKPPKDFDSVGKEFFPEFTNASDAKSLEVVSYDKETAEARVFAVDFKDGVWRIPSRHNYPADGKDRLAKTAVSMSGIKREKLISRQPSQYGDFDVIDPLSEDTTQLTGRGQRITLKDENGKVLASYVIGKAVPGHNGQFYIRPLDSNDKNVYAAKLNINLSTRFADWIEPDLLKLEANNIKTIIIDKYTVDENRGRLMGRETNQLTREKPTDPWVMTGLDPSKEEVNETEMKKLVDGLDNLKIVGVRPKPARLSRDLKFDKGIAIDPATQMDLLSSGFFPVKSEDGTSEIYSKEGDLVSMTDEGVVYVLRFGNVFNGTEEEVEFGFANRDESKDTDTKKVDENSNDPKATQPASTDPSKAKNRYLFVMAQFNPEALGPKPTPPVEPKPFVMPEGVKPADSATTADGPASATAPANTTLSADDIAAAQKAAAEAQARFMEETRKYKDELQEWETKKMFGEKQVKQLNQRFADWYYVISSDSFDALQQGRKTLIQPKKAEETTGQPAAPTPPGITLPGAP